MDDDLWSRLTVQVLGLDILAAPDDPTTHTTVSRQFAAELCAFWRERYEAVVLDMPDVGAAVDCGFAAQADNVLLVTSNELAALHAAGRCLRYLDAAAVDKAKVRLIVNRYAPAIGLPLEDLKAALSVEPFAVLSNDYQTIQTALLNGKPAPAASRFGAGVLALYRQLSQRGAPDQKNPSWLASLLHRK
jgi:Flp pilus assembly CpaE family ATPase